MTRNYKMFLHSSIICFYLDCPVRLISILASNRTRNRNPRTSSSPTASFSTSPPSQLLPLPRPPLDPRKNSHGKGFPPAAIGTYTHLFLGVNPLTKADISSSFPHDSCPWDAEWYTLPRQEADIRGCSSRFVSKSWTGGCSQVACRVRRGVGLRVQLDLGIGIDVATQAENLALVFQMVHTDYLCVGCLHFFATVVEMPRDLIRRL